ncbi:MAG TPA: hypothetical protein VIA18_23290 [Polyangia bacterium]|nr:hypothetical protein [Polyangia bacterium]
MRHTIVIGLCVAASASCNPALPKGQATPTTYFTSKTTDNHFYVANHFLASMEMQISGEPFAQLLGRNLAGYNRYSTVPDLYLDPKTNVVTVDPLSYSMAVESYEYSKQPMNNTSFESGAGLSMEYGPVLNPTGLTGDAAYTNLVDRLQTLATESGSGGPPNTNWVITPAPTDNPLNTLGWSGFWPVFAEFQSFDANINPTSGSMRGCSIVGGYAAATLGSQLVGDYECGYNSLNLPLRDIQVVKVLDPAAMGFAMWKQGLWVINYWQSLHDSAGNPISQVAAADLPMVGQPGNTVVGRYPDPSDPTGTSLIDGVPGVFLGDIALEGWQGLNMLDEMHNKATLLLTKLTTTDGATLSGFKSTADALAYDYTSPLRWIPAEVAVTETGGTMPAPGYSWRDFPQPATFTIQTPQSKLHGLVALLGGFAEMFALTDANNPDVGGQPSSLATFDGDPLPGDNGLPDGEDSPHDRALANIKVAVVNMDRLHFEPTHAVLVDTATAAQRGTTVTTLTTAYSIVALRAALRSISSTLVLYSNDTPDDVGIPTQLDGAPLNGAPAPLAARMLQLIRAQADFLAGTLVGASGAVVNSYDIGSNTSDGMPTAIESEASAIRGLLEAYLATSDTKYIMAAEKVYADLESRFWMSDVRAYRTTAGVDDTLTETPLAFGTLQGALRQYWKLVANQPGNEQLNAEILERVQRENKLVANGWDDANGDNKVQYPQECTGAGLQMGERTLTGELSHPEDNGDRDHDCVMEISVVKLPAALAGSVEFDRVDATSTQ